MSNVGAAAIGLVVGIIVGAHLSSESSCCARIGEAVHDKVVGRFGSTAGAVFDLFGGRKWAPGILDMAGL